MQSVQGRESKTGAGRGSFSHCPQCSRVASAVTRLSFFVVWVGNWAYKVGDNVRETQYGATQQRMKMAGNNSSTTALPLMVVAAGGTNRDDVGK